MLEMYNAKEREVQAWKDLLAAADQRFEWMNIERPECSKLSFIEVRWNAYAE